MIYICLISRAIWRAVWRWRRWRRWRNTWM